MTVKKPSDAEEEYFKKADLERVMRIRKQLDQKRAEAKSQQQKHQHWMRCPKCGSQMTETLFRHVMVDRCPTCHYIGFDNGELELLLSGDEPMLARLASELKRLFTVGRIGADPLSDR